MQPCTVWRFSDGKAGHDAQSLGLLAALAQLRRLNVLTPALLPNSSALLSWLGRCSPLWNDLAKPAIVIGAGHGTHLSLLAARRIYRCKTVVLMQPSLPLCLFDLCLIPAHDAPPQRRNVLITHGALNRMRPSARLDANHGLFLIGGPSAHFAWDSTQICQQLAAITHATPAVQWTLTTSRRTPDDFLPTLHRTHVPLAVMPYAATTPDWLAQQLQTAEQVWVSADSVSMIYEALTAGAALGVLDVAARQSSRVARGLQKLIDAGWVTPFAAYILGQRLPRPPHCFNEAQRCAAWMVEQWGV